VRDACSTLILGDNLFYGSMDFLRRALARRSGATVFGYPVHDPERYGVVEFDREGRVLSIEEKPPQPRSKYAIPGLYCYDRTVVERARALAPSARGELEITDLNRAYLADGSLHVELLGRGIAWLDTGTPQSLLEAGNFVASIENRQGLKVSCLEEIAFRKGFIDREQLLELAHGFKGNAYGAYLAELAEEEEA
jgi:glucose-1-phosphate thymidylyltransferase